MKSYTIHPVECPIQMNVMDIMATPPPENHRRMVGEVVEIDHELAVEFLLPRHYSGRVPSISKAYGWRIDGVLKAVCTFGKPASPFLCNGVCGPEYADRVYELNRLCKEADFNEPLSAFVGACLRRLRVERWIIVSYSDMAMQHHGYIYQACNFLYTGCTKERTDIFAGDGKHSRHYTDDDTNSSTRVVRSPKHRYIYFCTYIKTEKQAWQKALRYPILPYPKGDNASDYVLGTTISPVIIQAKGEEHDQTGSRKPTGRDAKNGGDGVDLLRRSDQKRL